MATPNQPKQFINYAFKPRVRVLERMTPKPGTFRRGTVAFVPGGRIGEYAAFVPEESTFGTDEQDRSLARGMGGNPAQDRDIPAQDTYTLAQLQQLAEQGYTVVVLKTDDAGPEEAKPHVTGVTSEPDGARITNSVAPGLGYTTQGRG